MGSGSFASLSMLRHIGAVNPPAGGAEAQRVTALFRGPQLVHPLPAGWDLGPWIAEGWVRDSMADGCARAQDWPFLRTGLVPHPGQRLYLNVRQGEGGGMAGAVVGQWGMAWRLPAHPLHCTQPARSGASGGT